MKFAAKSMLLAGLFASSLAFAQITSFTHIIIDIQENRTPDNLFYYLCSPPYGSSASCSTSPNGKQYDILTSNWADETSSTGFTQPLSVALANGYDISHSHDSFITTCNIDSAGVCRMDGGASTTCSGTCLSQPHYRYVDNSGSILNPYLTMATSYGWANYMFQTNQGPSFPSHQFLFGGTSAPSAADDAAGTFSDSDMNPSGNNPPAGCIAASNTTVDLIYADGATGKMYPCFDHQTLADLLEGVNVSWKFYTPGNGSILTAPNAISHICVPSAPYSGTCTGTYFTSDVVTSPNQILTDIGDCNLAGVSWVNPAGKNSDHPEMNTGGGPSWVASIVNAIGNNPKCKDGETYWNNTVILVTWDDWGGWYDHEPPTILTGVEGDFQYGFRVPFLVISAYTPAAYIDNTRMDFGTILRFVEKNFGITQGSLNFADARSSTNLSEFFNLNQVPRTFVTIPSKFDAKYFINDKEPPTDGDTY